MIREIHQKLLDKKTTSVKLTEDYFKTVEKKDPEVRAYLTLLKEDAFSRAAQVDAKIEKGEPLGILDGVPGAVKDNICLKGFRTTAGSKILDNYISPYDATVIERLKESGAVFLGKTNLDEFAMGSSTENSAYGPTKNPRDLSRVPGGSSGGSAAAVASDQAVWALGTDTGGSIRQPASFCGVVGLKPTYGRVSRYGAVAMASSFDQIGPITKTVEDAAIVLSAISGFDGRDATSARSFQGKRYEDFLTGEIKGMKIGVVEKYMENLGNEERRSLEKVIKKFKDLGAEMEPIELPLADYSLPAYYVAMPSEVSSNLARFDGMRYGLRSDDKEYSQAEENFLSGDLLETYLDSRNYGLGKEVKRRIMLGTYALSSGYYEAYYLKAQKARALIRKDLEKAFLKVDLILTPTAPTPAFKLGEKTDDPLQMYLADVFTITANIAGIPAISVPGPEVSPEGPGGKKMPFGFQLSGKWFDEENLLRAAHAYEINQK